MKAKVVKLTIPLLSLALVTMAQVPFNLPTDQNGKITYSQVVAAPDYNQDLLFANAQGFMNSLIKNSKNIKKKNLQVDVEQFEVRLPLHFTVYNEFPVKSPHGRIHYTLTISSKEARYRYLATDFKFRYLKRNRYGKFEEVAGKSKALEAPFMKGNQKLWEQHKQNLDIKLTGLTETLKTAMAVPEAGPEKEIVKVNDDW